MKKGLGRGLNALLDGVNSAGEARIRKENTPEATKETGQLDESGSVVMVDIRKVEPNPTQPRKFFDESALAELADSMKALGIIQPLVVNKEKDGRYTIIAGERRYRAARLAQITEVPVVVKEYTEMEMLQAAIIENIQRQDLTSIEEAVSYKRLMTEFFFSADDIALKLGRNKHAIISALHLLELAPPVQQLAAESKITASHAKALLSVEDPELQAYCAEKIVLEGLSVRAAETMIAQELKLTEKALDKAKKDAANDKASAAAMESINNAYRKAETELKRVLGSQVHIRPGKKVSKIEIEYYSLQDLERIMEIFKATH